MGLVAAVVLALLAGCTSADRAATPVSPGATTRPPDTTTVVVPSPTATPTPTPTPVVFDAAAAFATVEQLAGGIGPREAASRAFQEAAAYVASRFEKLGFAVEQQPVPVPAGDSWGVPVKAGTSANVIANRRGFDRSIPHIVIGAHLDTVAVAPGGEDNASGIAVLLELARMAAVRPPPVPVRFIAFGAEEPRGRGDALHHFGSQDYVASLSAAERTAVVAMVSLDRVGVPADAVPVTTGGTGTSAVREALRAAAEQAGIRTAADKNRASDHWSFEKAGIPAARVGSVPYPEYHSERDVPSVVDPAQLQVAGTIVWTWLQAR